MLQRYCIERYITWPCKRSLVLRCTSRCCILSTNMSTPARRRPSRSRTRRRSVRKHSSSASATLAEDPGSGWSSATWRCEGQPIYKPLQRIFRLKESTCISLLLCNISITYYKPNIYKLYTQEKYFCRKLWTSNLITKFTTTLSFYHNNIRSISASSLSVSHFYRHYQLRNIGVTVVVIVLSIISPNI